MIKDTYFGNCEECGKWYFIKFSETNECNDVLCPHCETPSQNWDEDLLSVKSAINLLKTLPQDAPLFFSSDRDCMNIYTACTIDTDAFKGIVVLRPAGENLEEGLLSEDLRRQPAENLSAGPTI